MKLKAFTLVEIMIVIGIVVVMAVMAIPGLLRGRLTANQGMARSTLKTIATACESYYASNAVFPSNMTALTGANPAYLNQDYTATNRQGYNFSCSFATTGYSCTATPLTCNFTGVETFTITTGAMLVYTGC